MQIGIRAQVKGRTRYHAVDRELQAIVGHIVDVQVIETSHPAGLVGGAVEAQLLREAGGIHAGVVHRLVGRATIDVEEQQFS